MNLDEFIRKRKELQNKISELSTIINYVYNNYVVKVETSMGDKKLPLTKVGTDGIMKDLRQQRADLEKELDNLEAKVSISE